MKGDTNANTAMCVNAADVPTNKNQKAVRISWV
jgi:hypothetical protein